MSEARIVTILFTDLVGSTELTDRLGDDAAEQIRRTHFSLLRDAVQAHGGEEVKNLGDGLMVVFGSAVEAVAAGVDIQRAVDRHNRRPGARHQIVVRVGLHLGEPIKEEGDYFGGAVNVAKRLCDAADGAQILCSDLVRGLARARSEVEFRRLDAIELKGISEPVEPYEVVWAPERVSQVTLPPTLNAPSRTPYVGRSQAREELRANWKRAVAGERRTVLVAGEPGIGKTRLSTEIAREAHEQGATVLYGRCDEEAVVPYQPFVEAMRYYVAHASPDDLRDQVGEMGADLARLIPEIRERVPGLPEAPPLDPEAERYRLFLAVARLFTEAARAAPLFLLLDDLHWADRPTLALLKHVIRATDSSAILICGTYRDVELSRRHPFAEVLADLRREHAYERVLLRGLSQDEVVSFLEAVSQQSVDERGTELAGALHTETEGNPFFIEEILLHLAETGRIYQDESGRWISDVDDVQQLEIPEGVREAVGRRLARLSEAANDALTAASVIGPRFEFAVLTHMIDIDNEVLSRALEEALSSQLVIEASDASGPSYGFAHALVRQVLYEELSLPRRQQLHLRAGDALAAVHTREVPFGAIAAHYRAAGTAADTQRAIDFSLFAGQRAASVYAFEEALKHLEAARELMAEIDTPLDVRARLLRYIGDLRYVTGLEYENGVVALEEALRVYTDIGDDLRAAQIHARLGRAFSTFPGWTDINRALEHFWAAERTLSAAEETSATGYTYIGLAGAALWALRTDEGLEASQRAMEIADRLGRKILWANAAAMHGWHLAAAGRVREGFDHLDAAYDIADRLEHSATGFLAAWMRGFISVFVCDPHEAIHWYERELAKPRLVSAPNLRSRLRMQLAYAWAMAGIAEPLAALAAEDTEDMADMMGSATFNLKYLAGDWDELIERTERRRPSIETSGSRFELGAMDFNIGDMSFRRGEYAVAEPRSRRSADAGHAIAATWGRRTLIDTYHRTGRLADAERELTAMSSVIDEGWSGAVGVLRHAQGCVAALRGDVDDADKLFVEAASTARRFGTPHLVADALVSSAVVRRERGDADGARTRVAEATDIFRRHGYGQSWIDYAESVLRGA